jgi:hypothetical protein
MFQPGHGYRFWSARDVEYMVMDGRLSYDLGVLLHNRGISNPGHRRAVAISLVAGTMEADGVRLDVLGMAYEITQEVARIRNMCPPTRELAVRDSALVLRDPTSIDRPYKLPSKNAFKKLLTCAGETSELRQLTARIWVTTENTLVAGLQMSKPLVIELRQRYGRALLDFEINLPTQALLIRFTLLAHWIGEINLALVDRGLIGEACTPWVYDAAQWLTQPENLVSAEITRTRLNERIETWFFTIAEAHQPETLTTGWDAPEALEEEIGSALPVERRGTVDPLVAILYEGGVIAEAMNQEEG